MPPDDTSTLEIDEVEEWARLKQILADALACEDAERRAAFLYRACAGHPERLRQAQRLLEQPTEGFDAFAEIVNPPSDQQPDNLVGQQLGAYRIVRQIGRGGMGTVYVAERADGQFQKSVAIKILKNGLDAEEVLRRFQIEREILAGLEHPNITRLLDAGTTSEGLPYFIMQFVEGAPITEFAEQQRLSLEQKVRLFRKVCGAVEFAHQHGIVHRDIKPSNILVGVDGEPKLLDFGIAKMELNPEDDTTVTLPANRRLTPKYASPEQRAGDPIDKKTDIYSLGAVLLELLSIEPDQSRGHGHIPACFGRVVTRAMAVDSRMRFPSAAGLSEAAANCLNRGTKLFSKGLLVTAAAATVGAVIYFAAWPHLTNTSPLRANTPAQKSIAVLPFQDVGPAADQSSVGLGIADSIIQRLARTRSIEVLPIDSVLRVRDRQSAGKTLNVDTVLTGTAERIDNQIRGTVLLIDVKTQNKIWSDSFQVSPARLYATCQSVSESIGRLLAESDGPNRSINHSIAPDPQAYDAYIMGLHFWSRRTRTDLDKAISYLTTATMKDPNFARAFALQADCYHLKAFLKYGPELEMMQRGGDAAKRAISLDPSIAEAHVAMAAVHFWEEKPYEAIRSLEQALTLNPNLAIAHQRYAWALCDPATLSKALQSMKRAVQLDPLSPTNNAALGAFYIFSRDYQSAFRACARAVELEPNTSVALPNFAWINHLLGRYDEAIAGYRRLGEIEPSKRKDALALEAAVLYSAGRAPEAEKLRPAIDQFAASNEVDPYTMLLFYTARDEFDTALAIVQQNRNTMIYNPMVLLDPLLDPLRKDRRFFPILSGR